MYFVRELENSRFQAQSYFFCLVCYVFIYNKHNKHIHLQLDSANNVNMWKFGTCSLQIQINNFSDSHHL